MLILRKHNWKCRISTLCVTLLLLMVVPTHASAAPSASYDIVIYGGTSAAVIAAVQAAQMEKTVVIVSPDVHLGGLSSGGLGWTDSGDKSVIGGLSRLFYHRIWRHYSRDDAWVWQQREQYGNRGQGTVAMDGESRTMWIFEPHVAEKVFEDLVTEFRVPIYRNQWLDRADGVRKEGSRIVSITTLCGKTYRGKMFIDATYEGDLMAAAGVSYTVGREANSVYGETLNGVQIRPSNRPECLGRTLSDEHRRRGPRGHYFAYEVSPYVVADDPSSGLLPRVHDEPVGEPGQGDHRVQAYNFRMCLTDHPGNRVPFPKPEDYDPHQYEILLRTLLAGSRHVFGKFDPIPNRKTDTNNHGPFSTDNIGYNHDYPEADYVRRREIIQEHRTYQQGYLYFLANDPRVPEDVREHFNRWGLAKDEFVDNGHWPHQLYVREARRMVSDFVITELHLTRQKTTPRPIGMGSYNMDSHHTQRYIAYNKEGRAYVQNEGDVQVNPGGPYPIDYGAIVPKRDECSNLLVPVCVSSSHITFGSIRMEPVFMILAQSAATAAAMAIDIDGAVQEVDYAALRQRLLADGQVLGGILENTNGTVIDSEQHAAVVLTGQWDASSAIPGYVGTHYLHDSNTGKGKKSALFMLNVPTSGRYKAYLCWTESANRATNVPVTVNHDEGQTHHTVNQRTGGGRWNLLGEYRFTEQTGSVLIDTTDTDGVVVVDAVLLSPSIADGTADSSYIGPDKVVMVEEKVWTPINWASFDQDKIVSYNEYQYTVYWGADRELCVARRHLQTNEVQIVRFNDYILADGRPEGQQRNGHRNTVIGISPGDGRLHLSWDHHYNDLNYMRSQKGLITDPPETLGAAHFEPRQPLTQEDPQRVTYPRFFNDPDGRLYFFYRTGGSGRGDSVFFEYDHHHGTWQIISDRLFAHEGLYPAWENSTSRNAYMHDILFDTAGRLHISWVYRETSRTWASNHDLHYAYSEDQGRTWKNNQGNIIADTRQGQRIVLDSPDIVVYEIPVFSWLINQAGMTLDSQNRPHVATFHMERPYVPANLEHNPPANARDQLNYYHYWRDHSGKWHRSEPLPMSGGRPVIVAACNDMIIIYFSTKQGFMAHAARACDSWQTWTTLRLTGPEFRVPDATKPDRRLLREHGILSFTVNPSPINENFGFAILEFNIQRILTGISGNI